MDLWDISVALTEVISLSKKAFIPISSSVMEEIFEVQQWKYLGYMFDQGVELNSLQQLLPSAKIIEVKNIWERETIEIINKYVLEHEKAFLFKPLTSNPYKFVYYLICWKKRSERIKSASMINTIPKIERLLMIDIGRAKYIHKHESIEFINKRDEKIREFVQSLKY